VILKREIEEEHEWIWCQMDVWRSQYRGYKMSSQFLHGERLDMINRLHFKK